MTSQVEAPVETAESDEPQVPSDTEPTTTARSRGPWVLLLVAALVAASGAFMWWQADHDPDRAAAQTRDTVLIEARQAIETMNTLDYRSVDKGVKAWSQVTTGTLRDQLAGVSADDRTLLAEQKKISTGRVVDAAVIDVDDGSATVIAAVEVTVRDAAKPNSEPTVKRNRFSADLVKVGGRWKLESLQQVAVSLS
ncbi:nuclear transport factor 2 family protein [Aeromicrobium endophyticum]|uniref:nuclear transport factor 2 family protein n=1 Tax=Aeromicrobium endophyticum TaxID=2292704 RepID=UPI0011C47809|nr:nuclear transport factor 2 family protein [Aeromicrobium endophyticum]